MKTVFYSKDKAEKEKAETKKINSEAEHRTKYLETLNKNRNFQKYVLSIIKEEITANENISGDLANLVGADPETVKSLIVGKSGALTSARNIYNKIVNC